MQILGKLLKGKRQQDRVAPMPQALDTLAGELAPSAEKSSQDRLQSDLEVSEANDQTMAEWWNVAHRQKREFWLTGSRGPEVWQNLNVTARVRPGQVVLNIEIGRAHV